MLSLKLVWRKSILNWNYRKLFLGLEEQAEDREVKQISQNLKQARHKNFFEKKPPLPGGETQPEDASDFLAATTHFQIFGERRNFCNCNVIVYSNEEKKLIIVHSYAPSVWSSHTFKTCKADKENILHSLHFNKIAFVIVKLNKTFRQCRCTGLNWIQECGSTISSW